jgi:hypothetical protein
MSLGKMDDWGSWKLTSAPHSTHYTHLVLAKANSIVEQTPPTAQKFAFIFPV